MKYLLVQLLSAIMGVRSAPPSTPESLPALVAETGSMRALAKPALIVDILKDLIHHMIDQLFSIMTYCTKLELSRCTLFEFVQPLLKIHIENI